MPKNQNHKEFLLPPGVRLDTFLFQQLGEKYSRSKLQSLIRQGHARVEGQVIEKNSYQAKTETRLLFDLPQEKVVELLPVDSPVPVLYQDTYLAVVHKPAGMTVHPGAGTAEDTLVHSLLGQLKTLSTGSEADRPGIVHRLDRETEGLMVIARTDQAHARLAAMFQQRQVQKTYLAFLWGCLKPSEDTVSGYISRNPRQRKQMVFSKTSEGAINPKEARLAYRVTGQNEYITRVEINLFTGRTHQVRATFSALGHPVIGDEIYGRQLKKSRKVPTQWQAELSGRGMLLLARDLGFKHPYNEKQVNFSLDVPERFKGLL